MTTLAERPAKTFPTNQSAPAPRGGSYVTLPAGSVTVGRGSYVTVPGSRNVSRPTRGSYVTAAGALVVPADTVEGSYLTLPAA
ncbi:hypothetical protein [Arthrobacter sp. NicSoilC5]|uniref:hypothetical protein n=1 Tax=Arthrobacter sp. NicSoilC5 TaxID=2831000 RepID=UPI001CC36603|nr:hypothetical protein [Arthrobacter sp. NicSoilC5]BCW81808.1 hypothetical protein NicSoilC5_38270 [Arthrobacter sp. NicSoilC5]